MSELRNIEMEGMILGDHCPGQDTLQLRIFVFVQLLGCGHIFCIFTKVGVFTHGIYAQPRDGTRRGKWWTVGAC